MTPARLLPFATVAATTALVAVAVALSPRGDEGYDKLNQQCDEVATSFAVLHSEIAELDQELYKSLDMMRRAPEDEQLDAMQTVLEEMAMQRVVIRDKMKIAHQQLVVHFMTHMAKHPSGDEAGVTACPLMKYMATEPEISGTSNVQAPLDR